MYASEEKKADKLVFGMESILTGDFDQLYRSCERELVHYLAVRRLMRIIGELEDLKELQSTGGTVVKAADPKFPPELPTLLHDLQWPLPTLLEPILTFALECHSILRSAYIFFTIHFQQLDMSVREDRRSDAAKKLLFELNQLEYFVDALDHTLIPVPGVRRSLRTIPMMHETANAVRKYAKQFAVTLRFFQDTELQTENEEEATKLFFAAVDKSMAPILSM
jgi:hypothetical protein